MKYLMLLMMALPLLVFGQSAKYTEVQNKSIAIGTNGFVEYLPPNYNSGTFPLVIFLHGTGERGNGSSELYKVSTIGPTNYLKWAGWTPNVIMIAPQWLGPSTWPGPDVVDQVVEYVIANYRVDRNRIYLTGLSMGGGATWDYAASSATRAQKLAAILPVCGYSGAWQQAPVIAQNNLPVLATHNNNDPSVPYIMSVTWVNNINALKPTPSAVLLTYNNGSHNAWDSTYNPSLTLLNGRLNWLDWMLQYSRGASAPAPPAATAPPTGPTMLILPSDERYLINTRGWVLSTQDIYGSSKVISGTTQQNFFNTERWGAFGYNIPVSNGNYSVKFYLAELYHSSPGKRIFSIDIEGARVLSNYDMLAVAPKFTALEKTFTVAITDGFMNINFVPVVDNAKITGIEITPLANTVQNYSSTIEIRDSISNTLLKTYSDVFTAPVKVVIKN